EARVSSLPVTVLAQRKQLGLGRFGLGAFERRHHKWLFAAVGFGLLAVVVAIMALAGGDDKRTPTAAAQPPEHIVTVKPPPEPDESTEKPTIEVTPAEPSIDLVRPEELDVEAAPQPARQAVPPR